MEKKGNDNSDTNVKEVEFDELLTNYIGEFGPFQWFALFLLCHESIITCFVVLSPVFIASVPDHWCDITDNVNISTCTQNEIQTNLLPQEERDGKIQHSQCQRYEYEPQNASFKCLGVNDSNLASVECTKWIYHDGIFDNTIVTEWDLVCSKSWWISNVNAVFWIGKVIGLLIWGHLGDRYGRRYPTLLGSILFYVFSAGLVFSPNYWFFLAARLCVSMALSGKDVTISVSCIEAFGVSWRVFSLTVGCIAFSLAYSIMAGIAYLETRWRYFLIWTTLPDIFIFFAYLLFAACLVYWGISMNIGNFGGSVYINFILSGVVDVPGYLLAFYLFKKFGRILTLGWSSIGGGIVLAVSFFLPPDVPWLFVGAALVGKMFIALIFGALWIYTTEVYPTSIRNIGLSTMSSVARVGSFIASYIGGLISVHKALPLVIFGASAFVAGGVTFILPETKGQTLKQTVEEGDTFMKENMCQVYNCCKKIGKKNQDAKTLENGNLPLTGDIKGLQ